MLCLGSVLGDSVLVLLCVSTAVRVLVPVSLHTSVHMFVYISIVSMCVQYRGSSQVTPPSPTPAPAHPAGRVDDSGAKPCH